MGTRRRIRSFFNRMTLFLITAVLVAACGDAAPSGGNPTAATEPTAASQPTAAMAEPTAAMAEPTAAMAEPTAGSASAPTTSTVDTSRRLAEPVTIEIFTVVQSVELPPPGDDWLIAKMVKEALNIDLKMSWQTDISEYERLVTTRAAANDLPDLFQSSVNLGRDLGAQGLLADWRPLWQNMPTYAKERNVEELAASGTFDGKVYVMTTKTSDPFKNAIIVRKDWMDKLGLQTPKTLDEFLGVMKAFTEKDPDGNGQNDTWGYTSSVDSSGLLEKFEPIYGAFGALGDWRVDNNTLVYVPTSPERLEALKFINRMQQEGVMDPDWSSQKPADRGNKWKSGRIGVFTEDWCAAFCKGNIDPFIEAVPEGEILDIAPPVGPNGLSAVGTYSTAGRRYSVSQRAIDQGKGEAIALFLEWLNTDGYYLTAFGQEGVNWKRENGRIIPEQDDASRILKGLSGWAFKGTDDEWRARYQQVNEYPNGRTIEVWPIEQRAQEFPKVDITPFVALPPAPADKAADLTRLKAEAELQFATGQRPFEEWDSYVESLKAAGLSEWQASAEQRAKEIGLIK